MHHQLHPKKAILIARVSTEEQREAGNSLPAQVVRLERYCQSKGFKVMKICSFDESAYSDDRTEFDTIIDFILNQKEKIALCCDKVDRLSRNMFDKRISLLYEKALNDEIELHFVSDGQVITSRISAVEKFQFGINLGLAKYYSDAISDNVKRAIEGKLRKGEWIAKAPYGYKNIKVGDKKDIVMDEYEALIVKKLFELYSTKAYSLSTLCQKMKDEHGVDWLRSHLDKTLNNPFYYGMMPVKGKLYPHRYPTVITKQLYDKVQAIKKGLNKSHANYKGKEFIYRGLLRCGDCGLSITPERQKGFNYYHCTQYKGKHDAKWFREEKITEIVESIFRKLQLPEEIVESIAEALNAGQQDTIDFNNIEHQKLIREQTKVSNALDKLYMEKLDGSITESEYDRFYQRFKEKLDIISDRLAEIQEFDDTFYITSRYVLNLSEHAYDLFLSSEVEEKRQLMKLVLQNLEIKGEKILWEAHSPFDLLLDCANCIQWRP